MHDGLTDVIYVLLPIWQAQFGLSYAQIGLLRGAYAGMMAGFQLLASRAAARWGRERLLVGGTALAGLAYLLAGQADIAFNPSGGFHHAHAAHAPKDRLQPFVYEPGAAEAGILGSYLDELRACGFEIEPFSGRSFAVSAMSSFITSRS